MAEKTLTIDREQWGEAVEEMLRPACSVIDEVCAQVESGKALLFVGNGEEKRMFAFVLRVDELAAGPQGVIVAAAGKGDGINLTDSILPVIESMFKECTSVRIHTARRGLAKKLPLHGYRFEEMVFTKELKNDPAA